MLNTIYNAVYLSIFIAFIRKTLDKIIPSFKGRYILVYNTDSDACLIYARSNSIQELHAIVEDIATSIPKEYFNLKNPREMFKVHDLKRFAPRLTLSIFESQKYLADMGTGAVDVLEKLLVVLRRHGQSMETTTIRVTLPFFPL